MTKPNVKQIEFYYDDPIKAAWAQKFLGLRFKEPINSQDFCEITVDFTHGMTIKIKMDGRFWLSDIDVWKLDRLPEEKKRALKLLGLVPESEESKAEEEESR